MNKLYQKQLKTTDYNPNLGGIKHSPKELYFLGNELVLKERHFLAVVGTRKVSPYGKRVLRYILPEIAKRKIVIVSGLARGIDCLAHEIALEYNCPTIAVMAGGLDQIYPPEHKKFSEDIVSSGGVLISEHPPGTGYLKQYFPARNRIISGLSDAVLVVEAKQKSGALITANFAFSQGRKVLAVPGNIFSEQSQGVNGLFKKGALPVQSPEDLVEVLFGKKRRRCSKKCVEVVSKLVTPEEKAILEHVSYDFPIPLSNIIRKAALPAPKVIAIVTQMEIKGLIEAIESGYVRVE